MTEPVDWSAGAPRSPRFGDTYFSLEDGLAESRAVFLTGCGLPDRWRESRVFTVAELGFGTGLNILALLDLWSRTRPEGGQLAIFSVEGFPISADDARASLSAWPELSGLAAPLLADWPGDGRRGWRRYEWPAIGARLDLAVAEVEDALAQWSGLADAWLLDGFAPARNPEMWTDAVLDGVRARSAAGAWAASFTVAGAVRRGLAARGFEVRRRPGFGRKKERLEAVLPGETPRRSSAPTVAVIGAGIAGASLARAFRRWGLDVRVFDADGPGAGASGNPAALVTPRLDAGLGPVAALHAQAFARAVTLYETETPAAVVARSALQLETGPKDAGRFDLIAAWDGFAADALARLSAPSAADRLGESVGAGALVYRDALVVEPGVILRAWLGETEAAAVTRLEPCGCRWRLWSRDGALGEVDVAVVAAGHRTPTLGEGLPIRPVRGQVSIAPVRFEGAPAAWGGYAIPTRTGTLFGATHGRGDDDSARRAEDDVRNRAELAKGRPALAARIVGSPLEARAAIRAATPDHMPVAGPLGRGIYVLSGFGGRGFTLAPLLAEQVAAEVVGAPRPLPERLAARVRPDRFKT